MVCWSWWRPSVWPDAMTQDLHVHPEMNVQCEYFPAMNYGSLVPTVFWVNK